MSRKSGWLWIGLVICGAGGAQGQAAVQVDGGDQPAARFRSATPLNEAVLLAEVTHSELSNSIAVEGIARPVPGLGIGGSFSGGFIGAVGNATLSGPMVRIGLFGEAWGGIENSGVVGMAAGNPRSFGVRGYSADADENFGVEGRASGEGAVNYGVWGLAEDGTFNYGLRARAVAPNDDWKLAAGVLGEASCADGGVLCAKVAVYASGDLAYTGSLLDMSDLRFKESLAPLERALPSLLELEVVSYEHLRTEETDHMNLPTGPQVGFVAQQVAEVLPDLVVEAVHPPAEDPLDRRLVGEPVRYQALKTIELIPYLVRAIQEQQAEIEALKAELLALRNRLAELEPGAEAEESQIAAAF